MEDPHDAAEIQHMKIFCVDQGFYLRSLKHKLHCLTALKPKHMK